MRRLVEKVQQKPLEAFVVATVILALGAALGAVATMYVFPPNPQPLCSDLGISDGSSLREDVPYGYMILSNESRGVVGISYIAVWQYNKYNQIAFPGGVVGEVITNDTDENSSTFFSINGKMLEMKKNSINPNQSYIVVTADNYSEYDYRNPPATQAWWEIRVEKNNYMAEVSWSASPPKGKTVVLPTTGKNFTYIGFMPNETGDFVPMFIW